MAHSIGSAPWSAPASGSTSTCVNDTASKLSDDDAEKIVSQIDSLGVELRHSTGAAGLAYEAAHLFSCYG